MADRTRRVLYLCEFPTVSGGENSLLTLLRHLDRGLFEPVVAAPPGGRLVGRLRELAVEHHPVAISRRRHPADHWAAAIAALAVAQSIDLIHANSLSTADIAAGAALRTGRPAVAHVRDIVGLSSRRWHRVSAVDRLIAVSHAVEGWIVAAGVPAYRVEVVANGIDADAFASPRSVGGELRRALSLPDEALVVLSIGQLVRRKGHDVALAAFEALVGGGVDARLLIAGERYSDKDEAVEYEADLRGRAESAPLAGRVRFLGYRDDVPALLAASDVLLHAAHQEPLGRVLLEAMAAGRPVVATAVGGTPEMIDDGVEGLLAPPGDGPALARALAALAADPGRRRAMGRAARRRVEASFDPDRMARRIERIYAGLGAS